MDDSSNSEFPIRARDVMSSSSSGVVGHDLEVGSVVENSAVTALVVVVLAVRPKLPDA